MKPSNDLGNRTKELRAKGEGVQKRHIDTKVVHMPVPSFLYFPIPWEYNSVTKRSWSHFFLRHSRGTKGNSSRGEEKRRYLMIKMTKSTTQSTPSHLQIMQTPLKTIRVKRGQFVQEWKDNLVLFIVWQSGPNDRSRWPWGLLDWQFPMVRALSQYYIFPAHQCRGKSIRVMWAECWYAPTWPVFWTDSPWC